MTNHPLKKIHQSAATWASTSHNQQSRTLLDGIFISWASSPYFAVLLWLLFCGFWGYFLKIQQLERIDSLLKLFYPVTFFLEDILLSALQETLSLLVQSLILSWLWSSPFLLLLRLAACYSPLILLASFSTYSHFGATYLFLKIVILAGLWLHTCWPSLENRQHLQKRGQELWPLAVIVVGLTIYFLPLIDPSHLLFIRHEGDWIFPNIYTGIMEPLLYLQEPAWNPKLALGGYPLIYPLGGYYHTLMHALLWFFKPSPVDIFSMYGLYRLAFFVQIPLAASGLYVFFQRLHFSQGISLTIALCGVSSCGYLSLFPEYHFGMTLYLLPWLYFFILDSLPHQGKALLYGFIYGVLCTLHFLHIEQAIIYYYMGGIFFLCQLLTCNQATSRFKFIRNFLFFNAASLLSNYKLIAAIIDYFWVHGYSIINQTEIYDATSTPEALKFILWPLLGFANSPGQQQHTFFNGCFFSLLFLLGLYQLIRFPKQHFDAALRLWMVLAPLTFIMCSGPFAILLRKLHIPAFPSHNLMRYAGILYLPWLLLAALALERLWPKAVAIEQTPKSKKNARQQKPNNLIHLGLTLPGLLYLLIIGIIGKQYPSMILSLLILLILTLLPFFQKKAVLVCCLLIASSVVSWPQTIQPFGLYQSLNSRFWQGEKTPTSPCVTNDYQLAAPYWLRAAPYRSDIRLALHLAAYDLDNPQTLAYLKLYGIEGLPLQSQKIEDSFALLKQYHASSFVDAYRLKNPGEHEAFRRLFYFNSPWVTEDIEPRRSRVPGMFNFEIYYPEDLQENKQQEASLLELSSFFFTGPTSFRWYHQLDPWMGIPNSSEITYIWNYLYNARPWQIALLGAQQWLLWEPALNIKIENMQNMLPQRSSQDSNLVVLKDLSAHPRAFLYHQWYPYHSQQANSLLDAEGLLNQERDLLEKYVLEKAVLDWPHPHNTPEEVLGIKEIAITPHYDAVENWKAIGNFAVFHLKANLPPGIFFYADMYHRDWQVFEADKQSPLLKSQLSFKGMPYYSHSPFIWMEFRSKILYLSKLFFLLGACLAFWLYGGTSAQKKSIQ